MRVYAYYNPDSLPEHKDADFLRLWERSWRLQGWEPRILTPLNGLFDEAVGGTKGGAWYCNSRVINFGFKPWRPERLLYTAPGLFWVARNRTEDWAKCKLVPDRDSRSISAVFEGDKFPLRMLVFFEGRTDTSCIPALR
jgi:hypothetical protein